MPILLRLDIDKPYGNRGVVKRILSKVREDYWFPQIRSAGYLVDFMRFIGELNEQGLPAISYHRLCTVPSTKALELLGLGGHQIGLHAEDTRSLETLKAEVECLRQMVPRQKLHSFTKHGSGELKLGRRHYAPNEPEKNQQWAQELALPFLFGNGLAESSSDFASTRAFYPNMFWLEPGYQSAAFGMEQALQAAAHGNLILIIHPENIYSQAGVHDQFWNMVAQAKQRGIGFIGDLS